MAHSRFAPSASEREYSCPASFLLSEGIPDHNTVYSAEGTAAHHVAALCLTHNHDTEIYAGCRVAVTDKGECRFLTEPNPLREGEMEFEVNDEMVAEVQDYVDWCRESPGEHHVEIRVEHTKWCPDLDEWGEPLGPQYGTSDFIAITDDTLEVTDLKYGKGEQVFAKENKQAIKYALGALDEFGWIHNIKFVRIRISQPRLDHRDVWECTVAELLAWGKRLKKRLELVFVDDPPFGPSEKACRFCKVSGRCKALDDHLFSERAFAFDEISEAPIDAKLLTDAELSSAWEKIPLLKIQIENVEKQVMRANLDGKTIPGLKIVQAQTHRRWKATEEEVIAELKKLGVSPGQCRTSKFISPNQAEKLISKTDEAKLEPLWIKPAGGPTIVRETDPRPAFDPKQHLIDGFEDVETDDGFDT